VVEDLAHECILGRDFLIKHRVDINLWKGEVKFNIDHPITTPREETNKSEEDIEEEEEPGSEIDVETIDVLSMRKIVIPPNTQVLLEGRLARPYSGKFEEKVVEEDETVLGQYGIHCVESITTGQEIVAVRLYNTRPNTVMIKKGNKIARVRGIKKVIELADFAVNQKDQDERLKKLIGPCIKEHKIPHCDYEKLESHVAEATKQLIREYQDLWSQGGDDLGQTEMVQHEIKLRAGDEKPIKQAPRSIPIHRQPVVKEMINEMLVNQIIEPSDSPWASPVVLAPKPDGTLRFCVDYRKINNITEKDAYPLPKIEDLLNQLDGSKYFAKLDLAAGYWQVKMKEEDKPKTAFCIPTGLYQFLIMPFGLVNAPPTFQRLMNRVLGNLLGKIAIVYIDDILIFGRTPEELLDNLRMVLDKLRKAGLKLKPSKCEIFKEKLCFLGHEVNKEGIRPLPTNRSSKRLARTKKCERVDFIRGTLLVLPKICKRFC
jgi:hypothetical protein